MYFYNLCSLLARISLFILPSVAVAQATYWKDIREELIQAAPADRLIIPNQYSTYRLQFDQLKALLSTAPLERDYVKTRLGIQIDFPMPDGSYATFEVWEAPVMSPELTAQYPDIRSFAGKNLDRKGMIARFDISPKGLHAMFLTVGENTVYIDPYARGNTIDYLCYYRKDSAKKDGSDFQCLVDDREPIGIPGPGVTDRAGDCGNLRQYRLALACTGEYANFHGSYGTDKAPALAAMNTSMNRVNGVFERDAGIRMVIIANNSNIIYTDPDTDPYTNDDGAAMLDENQATCDGVIGTANYDIGHAFSTGGGGIAALGSPCSTNFKAMGVTGLPSPVGDFFDIDYVAHEMGHQFNAQHTQYNNCQRSSASAMEPGSASTIMGYAGICSPNIQDHSDDYFHARSLQQIGSFVTSGGGGSCDQLVASGNSAPVAANLTDRTIPKSTPFILSGSATDPQGDVMSFCWEQMNAYSSPMQPMPPAATNTTGPVFRSLLPVSSGSRYFPNFDDVLAGIPTTWEVLPSIGRSLSFRMTVRDNNPSGGCTTEKNMTVTTSGTIGPFLVTAPNGGESYSAGSTQAITWNVANTTNAPVNCANVSILLSTDGGASFSILTSSTPNDGSENVTLNVAPTDAARIMIQAVGNVFYDVSNSDFAITTALPVELSAFAAVWENNAVRLKWTTATETNNRGYFIERSTGNTHLFANIGWVDGHGTTTLKQHYQYNDFAIQPGETYYYRLRQTDLDGAIHYSDIRTITVTGAGREIALFPNPANDKIRIEWPEGLHPGEGLVIILNETGRQVRELAYSAGSEELDIQTLPPGLYLVQTVWEGKIYSGKFFK